MKRFLVIFTCLVAMSLLANALSAKNNFSAEILDEGYPTLVSDYLFLRSTSVHSFDLQTFLDTMPGPLKDYSEELDGQSWSAAEIIDYQSIRFGINPQVILLLMEAEYHLLSSSISEVPMLPFSDSTSQNELSFYSYVGKRAESLTKAFYEKQYSSGESIVFIDVKTIIIPERINAGTYAVQKALATYLTQNAWEQWSIGEAPIFKQNFINWFGDPTFNPQIAEAVSVLPQDYILPFTVGETWYLTSGPHNHYGGNIGCISGSGCPRPWSAIDIAPPEVISCPGGNYPANRWVVAAKGGTVIQSSQARVVIDHGDGWQTHYSHIATDDRIGEGPVSQGQPIGHPSCEVEPGGSAFGVHVHFAIWQEGTGFVNIDGSLLSNWEIHESNHYHGTMSRNNEIRVANVGRLVGTNDLLNSVVLLSDTFSDGNFDGWTVVDVPGAYSAPSDWSVVEAKNNWVLLQDSNIYTAAEPYEGTYVYSGQSWWNDYHINIEIEPDDNDGIMVLFRYIDDDNYYRFFMDRERNNQRLEKKVDGVYTTLAENLLNGYGTDGWINVQITVSDTTITVFLDYLPIFTVDDTSHSTGMIGLGTWASTNTYFDNVIVSTSGFDPYADAVVDSNIKISGNGHSDPTQALGRPQFNNDFDYVAIGGPGYWFVVDMGQEEEIIDGPGNDLRIHEIGSSLGGIDEEYNVFVSNSPSGPWTFIGQGLTTSVFDLAGSGLESARYVRVEDLSTKTGNPFAGSDIEAIESLNMVGDLIIDAPSNFTKSVSSNDVILNWDSVERAEQYNIYASRSGGGGGYSLLDSILISSGILFKGSAETNTISYTHQNAADDEYFYVVTAVSPEGYESNFSVEVPYRLFIPLTIR